MSRSHDRLSLKRAFGLSTVLHLMLASLLTTSAALTIGRADRSTGSGTAETSRVSFMTIEHRGRAARTPAHARAAARRPVARSVPRPAPAAAAAAPAQEPAAAPARAALPRVALTLATAAPEGTPAPEAPRPAPADGGSPHEAPTEAPAPQAPTSVPSPPGAEAAEVAAHSEVPSGGWGQSFDKPLVADEAALADIRSHYPAGTVRIDVDEGGRATHISLPSGLSEEVRAELERRLLELRFVPAECNGLRCGGTLQITI
jgi:hypothetical protein